MSARVFLGLNGRRLDARRGPLYELVDGMATGSVDKAEVSIFLRRNCTSR
jgi:prophage maintenance system killer protein